MRVPHARLLVFAAAAVACTGILWLARDYTFFYDEWTFIVTAPDWTVATLFQPHNEHPSILFRLVYFALLNSVGLRSYLPYMVVTVLLHGANAVLMFEVVRRRAGDVLGMAAAFLLLVLGAGWEDMLWAFQMAWLASVGLGLASLVLLEAPGRPAPAAVAGLLAASIAFSGIGLAFGIAAFAVLALTPDRRKDLAWLVPVGVAFLTWYAVFGRFAGHPNPPPSAANIFLLPAYVAWGLASSAAGLIGVGGWASLGVLVAALAGVGTRWWRRGIDAWAIGIVLALVGFYVIAGLSRAQLGYQQAGAARYVYVGSTLWLILLADAARGLPRRGFWRPALAACLLAALVSSGATLVQSAAVRESAMQRQVADYYALAAMRSDPCLDPAGAVDLQVMPVETRPAAYYRAVDRYGDPRAGMPLLDRSSYEAGLRNVRKAGCGA